MKWYSDMLAALSEKVSWELGRDVEVVGMSEDVASDSVGGYIETTFWLSDQTTYDYPYSLSVFLEEHFEL